MGCQNTPPPSAASNTPVELRSNFVKHPLQNTENERHQWLSGSFRVLQNSFSAGAPGKAYSAPPDALAGLNGHTSKRRGDKGRDGRRK